jgi:hypothetical protein
MNGREVVGPVPIEHFIQALTSQLDRAQTAMALKAQAGMPLTFAVKDLSLDLRAHVDVEGAVVRIRPAGPGDTEASTLHLALTTITRPMIEENTVQLSADPDEPDLREAAGDELSSEDLRRLEWAGVQTVRQLVQLQQHAGESAIERIASVPAMRLRAALTRATQPMVREIVPGPSHAAEPDGPPVFHLRGRNLLRDTPPTVRLGNEALRVLRATPHELVVAPTATQLGGEIEIETAPGYRATCLLAPQARGGDA